MSDEEDYNSEEDVDYVPSDGELGSEEENSGDEEDLSLLADDGNTAAGGKKKKNKGKQKKNDFAPSKRRGGIRLEGGEGQHKGATGNINGDAENKELGQKIKEEEEQKKAEKEKNRANDLWSSFLTDVKPKPKGKPAVSQSVNSSSSNSSTGDSVKTSSLPSSSSSSTAMPKQSSGSTSDKITITKVFDFAGEEIKVTKEVSADSKEAKEELKKREEEEERQKSPPPPPSSSSSSSSLSTSLSIATNSRGLPFTGSTSAGAGILGVKRPAAEGGGLGSVLNKIGKKQKMGTLEKSKMDWDSFKKKEGIEEDLKIHNKGKDGYIERMSFLSRTDVRQFEIERSIRQSKRGKR